MSEPDGLARVRREMPQLEFREARDIGTGWDHAVLVLDNSLVVRFPKEAAAPGWFDREVAVLELVRQHSGIRVPRIVAFSDTRSMMAYEFIQGEVADTRAMAGMPAEASARFAQQLADTLRGIHALPVTRFEALGLPTRRARYYVEWIRDNQLPVLATRLDQTELDAIRAFFDELTATMDGTPHWTFLHGDLGFDAVVRPADGPLAVIDWSDAAIGDPAHDFMFLTETPAFGLEVLDRYQRASGPDYGDLLERARVYYKVIPIALMMNAIENNDHEFDATRKTFRAVFAL